MPSNQWGDYYVVPGLQGGQVDSPIEIETETTPNAPPNNLEINAGPVNNGSNQWGDYYIIDGEQGGPLDSPVNTNVPEIDPNAPPFNVTYDASSTEVYWLYAAGKLP